MKLLRVLLPVLLALPLAAQEPPAAKKMSPEERARFRAEREGKLKPGDAAPDFALRVRGGSETVRLSSFRGKKAVALIFGSYT